MQQSLDHGLPKIRTLEMEYDPDLKSLYRDPRFITMVADAKERAATTKTPE